MIAFSRADNTMIARWWLTVDRWTLGALFLLVGCAAPVLIGFFNNLTFESQLAFGEVAKTAIDSKRLEVLKLLRLPVPVSRSSERELWNRLRETDENAALADLVYAPEVRT